MAVILPRHAIDARSRLALERQVGFPELIAIDVVQECGEPFLLLQPCGLPYAFQAVGRALPARCPGRAVLRSPLAPALGSTNSSAGCPASFARFTATVAGSDSSPSCIAGFGSSPSRRGPLDSRAAKVEVSRFPVEERTYMPGSSTTQDRKTRSRWRAPPFCRPLMTTASASRLILSRLNGWPIGAPPAASPPPSRPTTHGSGPMRFAFPSPHWTGSTYSSRAPGAL